MGRSGAAANGSTRLPRRPGRSRRASAGDVPVRLGPPLPIGRPRREGGRDRGGPARARRGWVLEGRTADRVRALTLAPLGICELWLELPSAHRHLHEALHLARAVDVLPPEIAGLGGLALLERAQGRLRHAAHLARGAADAAEIPRPRKDCRMPPWDTRSRSDQLRMERPRRRRRSCAASWARSAARSGDRIARALSAYVDASLCLALGDGQIEIGLQRLEGVASDGSTVEAPAPRAACVSLHSRLAAAAGDHAAARTILERKLDESPDDAEASLALARLRLSAGEPDEALALLSVDGHDDAVDVIERAVLGAVAHRTLGNTEESRAATGRALRSERPKASAARCSTQAPRCGASHRPLAALDRASLVRVGSPLHAERPRGRRVGLSRAARASRPRVRRTSSATCRR